MLCIFLLALTPFSADKVEIMKEDGQSITHLLGNVIIEDPTTTIACGEARLNESKSSVILTKNVVISDKNGEINSDFAIYYFKERKGYLHGNVSLSTEDEVINSDSLFYDGVKEIVKMFRNVVVMDEKNNLVAYGETGWYDLKNDEGHLMDKPRLEITRDNKEPINIKANEFKLNTNNNLFYGFDSVIAVIDSITVYCDTFLYNLKTDAGTMTQPFILEKSNRLKGETGQFSMKNKEIESFSVQKGWSEYHSKEGAKNIVEGDTITVLFNRGKASKIEVSGEPKGLLYLKKEKEDAGNQESD